MSALDELLTNHEKPLQDKGWLEYSLVLFWEETDGYEYAAEYASEELAKLRDDNAALRSERDALKEALEYIRNYDNYASDGDVYIEDGDSYTHVSNYAESVIKAYSAGNE
jgi:hypothetical protein